MSYRVTIIDKQTGVCHANLIPLHLVLWAPNGIEFQVLANINRLCVTYTDDKDALPAPDVLTFSYNPFQVSIVRYDETMFRWEFHRKLWNYLSRNPRATKTEAIRELDMPYSIHDCFACDVGHRDVVKGGHCKCPLEWKGGDNQSQPCIFDARPGFDGLFTRWRMSDSTEERIKLAEMIRDLPLSDYGRAMELV